MKPVFEVHITKVFIVEGKDSTEARAKAMSAMLGQTADFEFGGMKFTTFKLNRKIKKDGCLPIKRKDTYAKKAAKRTDRSVGKEQDYVDFGEADHI
jgi:hypothetical protein